MNVAFSEKWLKTLAIIHIVGGLALPILIFSSLADSYINQLMTTFPNSNPESLRFLVGVFGPTIASWGALFYFVISKSFSSLNIKDWWFLVLVILLWGVVDSGYSWYFGIYQNLYLNLTVMLLLLVPLVATKNHFR